MNGSTFGIVLITAVLTALIAVAGASIIAAPATAPTTNAKPVASATVDTDKLRAELLADLQDDIRRQVPVADTGEATSNDNGDQSALLQAKDDEIAKLREELAATNAHLEALEAKFTEFEATQERRLEENLGNAGRSFMNQAREELEKRAPELMEQFGNRMVEGMGERLGLDDYQKEVFGKRMTGNMEEFMGIWQKTRAGEMSREEAQAEMQRIQKETEDEMRTTLTPEQYEQFEESGGMNFWQRGGRGQGGGGGWGGFGRNRGGNNDGGGNNTPELPERDRDGF